MGIHGKILGSNETKHLYSGEAQFHLVAVKLHLTWATVNCAPWTLQKNAKKLFGRD